MLRIHCFSFPSDLTNYFLQEDAPIIVFWVLCALLSEIFKNVGETFLSWKLLVFLCMVNSK